jgi:Skp family chaperone for outer membrane proteins
MFKKITKVALLSALILVPTVTQTGSGGAWAGGLLGGALIGSAITSAANRQPDTVYIQQPAPTVIYRDANSAPSSRKKQIARKLQEENNELRQEMRKMQREIEALKKAQK